MAEGRRPVNPLPKGLAVRHITPVSRGMPVRAVLADDLRKVEGIADEPDAMLRWCRSHGAVYVSMTPGKGWEQLAEGALRAGYSLMIVETSDRAKPPEV